MRVCVDCAGVTAEELPLPSPGGDAAAAAAAAVAVARLLPRGRGGALLLLYSLALSAGAGTGLGAVGAPLVDVSAEGSVSCIDALVTLAAWGSTGTGGDLASAAAAAPRGDGTPVAGVLLEGADACFAPAGAPSPTAWLALAGGHWRVLICSDGRLLAPPEGAATAPGENAGAGAGAGGLVFSALQLDGLPGRKTRSTAVSARLLCVRAPRGERGPWSAPPPAKERAPAAPAVVSDEARAAAAAASEVRDRWASLEKPRATGGSRRWHLVWERQNAALEAGFGAQAREPTASWYCSACYFSNQRENLSYGLEGFRNAFNSASSPECRSCSMAASVAGASCWVDEAALAVAAPAIAEALAERSDDWAEIALRVRWPGARAAASDDALTQVP